METRSRLCEAHAEGTPGVPLHRHPQSKKADANTQKLFGSYVPIYDIKGAEEDKMKVPIYYESRRA